MNTIETFRRTMRRHEKRAKREGIYAPQVWCRIARLDPFGEGGHIDFAERARQCRESDGGTRAFLYECAARAYEKLRAGLPPEAT